MIFISFLNSLGLHYMNLKYAYYVFFILKFNIIICKFIPAKVIRPLDIVFKYIKNFLIFLFIKSITFFNFQYYIFCVLSVDSPSLNLKTTPLYFEYQNDQQLKINLTLFPILHIGEKYIFFFFFISLFLVFINILIFYFFFF